MGGVNAKSLLRKELIRYKRLLSTSDYQERSQKLAKLTIEFLEFLRVDSFHAYLPIEKNREPDTFSIIDHFYRKDVKILISKTNFETFDMVHYYYNDTLKLSKNRLGIPEPLEGTEAPLSEVSTILMPLVCFDKMGNRLGYGGGFYDRLLEKDSQRFKKIGLCISSGFDLFPFVEDHDVQLDYCVTPEKIERFR